MSVFDTPSPSNSSLGSSPLSQDLPQRKCAICFRPAFSNNYGVLTCDACKMFYRRIVILNREYKCKYGGGCAHVAKSTVVKCKGCRYQQCLEAGMTFQPSFAELTNEKDFDAATTVATLRFLDSRRSNAMKTQFTDEDFSLLQVLEIRRMKMKARRSEITNHEWSFFGIYTSIEFLMSLDFMSSLNLSIQDKKILLKHYCVKASLFASAMRAMKEQRNTLMTVDGKEIYPDAILRLKQFSPQFLQRIRSLLVMKLIELKITDEEFALVNAIFFCNPALPLSEDGQKTVATQQKAYSSALLQFCNVESSRNGPTRFTNLLSLLHVINKNFEDVKAMTMLFRIFVKDVSYRKIVTDVI